MRVFCGLMVVCWAGLCLGQTSEKDQALLSQVRGKYDAPFNRELQSFDCAVGFSWKEHFKETTRVGDEGTDEELETLFQPIRNRVEVTRSRVTVTSGLSDEAMNKLPYGGMAEGLLEHAVEKSLYNWLAAGTNAILPDAKTPVSLQQSATGYRLAFKMQDVDVQMNLAPDMRLLDAVAKTPQPDRFETSFDTGPQGFVLRSWTVDEDGNVEPGHRLIFSYSYQMVDGVQVPEQVVVMRESHHEVWRYKLNDCKVKKVGK